MIKTKHAFLAGILIALAASIALVAFLSTASTHTLAQTSATKNSDSDTSAADQSMPVMQNNDEMMTNMTSTMMDGMSMLATNSMSMADGVRVTGLNIEDDDEISVNLEYTGAGSAPRVTVAAMTVSTTGMMNMMMAEHHGQMMAMNNDMNMMTMGGMDGNNPGMMTMNIGQGNSSNGMQSSMMSMHNGVQSGSNVLVSGWVSPSTVTIKLEGSSTASGDEIGHIMVMVFPFSE